MARRPPGNSGPSRCQPAWREGAATGSSGVWGTNGTGILCIPTSSTTQMIYLEDLLAPLGFPRDVAKRQLKLVRHMDRRVDLDTMLRDGRFEIYQAWQSSPVFSNATSIVSFTGRGERQATFVGVYDVGAASAPGDASPPSIDIGIDVRAHHHYALTKRSEFDALAGRLVIDWGEATRAWHQWYAPGLKPVVELLPEGYVKEFPGYLNVVLSFAELVTMVRNPTANREWHRMLSAAAGIYLVLDTKSGKQYIGSASGESGILGRWRSYAENGHAGNKLLAELVRNDHTAMQCLQFSILQTLDRALTRQEVLAFESLHKRKLGSRVHGLNEN